MTAKTHQTPPPYFLQFLTASLITSYPDDHFCEHLGLLLEDPHCSLTACPPGIPISSPVIPAKAGIHTDCITRVDSRLRGNDRGASSQTSSHLKIPRPLSHQLLRILSNPEALDDVRSEYIDLFDRGRDASPLYETEYGRARAMVKGNELADLAAFYKAFGFDFGGEGSSREMVDHVSVELEFYALLLLKQASLEEASDSEGCSIVLDARQKFLKDHLGRFLPAIAERPRVMQSAFYSAVFTACRAWVSEECARLNVDVKPVDYISGEAETESMCCGQQGFSAPLR